MNSVEGGKVYLVGAGPGDPELLTVKAVKLLAAAGVIYHDDLVPRAILDLAGKQTLVVSVGKRCGRKKITQAAIHEVMILSARKGLAVIRLKCGDPLIFGRAGEEMDALREAGVPFEVVPGVTAASAAGALIETSLTDRRGASKLIVLSGHHAAKAGDDRSLWSGQLPSDATLAVYMPGKELAQLAAALREAGLSGSLPCVLVREVSQPQAAYRACRLSDLHALSADFPPALLLVGEVFEGVLSRDANPDLRCLDQFADLAPPLHQH